MRKMTVLLLALCLLAAGASCALAAGTTLRVFTPFADVDFAAQSYMDMITAWEKESGNMVEDFSGIMDEIWLGQMRDAVDSGEADVVVLPLGSGLSAGQLVSAAELLAAAPDLGARLFSSMQEDGQILLVPLRLNWEALYVNTDVLAAAGLSVPETFEALLAACALLSQSGVTPISNALCDWPEIVLDCAALAGAPQAVYGSAESFAGAQDLLTVLTMVGAFGSDPWNAADADAEAAFLSGSAAMRIDTDSLAQMIDPSRADSVAVINLPVKSGEASGVVAGSPCYGVAITRSCWNDDARCAAAVSFVQALLEEESLVSPAGGALGQSIARLTAQASDCSGLLYDANPDSFDSWAEQVVAALMAL